MSISVDSVSGANKFSLLKHTINAMQNPKKLCLGEELCQVVRCNLFNNQYVSKKGNLHIGLPIKHSIFHYLMVITNLIRETNFYVEIYDFYNITQEQEREHEQICDDLLDTMKKIGLNNSILHAAIFALYPKKYEEVADIMELRKKFFEPITSEEAEEFKSKLLDLN